MGVVLQHGVHVSPTSCPVAGCNGYGVSFDFPPSR